MYKWSFPNNGFGQIMGVANAGLEHFRGEGLKALAREICQNSLDARRDVNKPVKVEFVFDSLPSKSIEGFSEYKKVLEQCLSYWGRENNQKAIQFLNEAKIESNRDRINFLRISDYNTTGLLWAYSDKADGWNALTKIDGGATKSGDEAGSFGIGKNAPFCNSYFRVVYYRTLNIDGEKAAQGVARIMSFPTDETDNMGSMTTGIGFYGNPEKNNPVENIDFLDKMYTRTEVGTDVFVCGFFWKSDWKTEICKEIIQNFAVSIYEGLIEVTVGDEKITRNTLERYVNRFNTKDNVSVYSVLTKKDEVKEYYKNLLGGRFRLRLFIKEQNDKSLNHKILVVRRVGMKLFYLPSFSKSIAHTGILDIQGEELSKFFREMENSNHDAWDHKKHPDPDRAKKAFDELKRWIEDIFDELGNKYIGDEIEVLGLGNILAKKNSSKAAEATNTPKEETISNEPAGIEVLVIRKKLPAKGTVLTKGSSEKLKTTPKKTRGTISVEGEDPAVRTLSGMRKRKKKVNHKGVPQQDGKDIVKDLPKASGDPRSLKQLRIIKIGKSIYKIVLECPQTIEKGYLELLTVGENGSSGKLRIKQVNNNKGCEDIFIEDGGVRFTNMKANEKVTFEIGLMEANDYAMEVKIHEHS